MATFTLDDTDTRTNLVTTTDPAVVRATIADQLHFDPAPAWLSLSVRWDGKTRTLTGAALLAWYRKGMTDDDPTT
jgi:hypothetical protein